MNEIYNYFSKINIIFLNIILKLMFRCILTFEKVAKMLKMDIEMGV